MITVEQYRQLPDREDIVQELHPGAVVNLPHPTMGRVKLHSRIAELLRSRSERFGITLTNVAFRALPEYDVRGTEIAFVSQQRCDSVPDDDDLRGSPDLVIEVLSSAKTRREIRQKAVLCLSSGALEFWLVDPKRKTVAVIRVGTETVYRSGDIIPLPLFDASLEVDEIFT